MVSSIFTKAVAALPALSLSMLIAQTPARATDVTEAELRRLFDPTTSELAAERKDRIYIYEGLRDIDVQRALDEEFNRVENMMFIRTIKTDEKGDVERDPHTGEVEVEDDGC